MPEVPVIVYTDGACSGNPGPGGWAWAVAPLGEPAASGGERATTNQRMEITAALEAVRPLSPAPRPAGGRGVRLDVRRQLLPRPLVGEVGGQRLAQRQRKPVANADLWRPLIELVKANPVTFHWVKGHSGDPMNDLVDAMAVAAIPR